MHVQPATSVCLEHRRAEQAHVPGRDDDVDPAIAEEIDHGAVEALPAFEVLRLEHGGLDAIGLAPVRAP